MLDMSDIDHPSETSSFPVTPGTHIVVLEMFEDHPPRIEARTPGAFIGGACFILAVLVDGELHVADSDVGMLTDSEGAGDSAPESLRDLMDSNTHLLDRIAALHGYEPGTLKASYESVVRVLRGDADVRAEFDAFMRGERAWGLAFVTSALDMIGGHVVSYLNRDFTLADADPTDPRTAVLAGLSTAAGLIEHPSADTGIDAGIVYLTVIKAGTLVAAEDIQANEFSREIEMHEWRASLAARGLSAIEIELLGSISLATMLVLEAQLSWAPNEKIGEGFRKAALDVLAAIPVDGSTPATAAVPSVEEKLVAMVQLLHLDEGAPRTDCDVAALINHITDVLAVLPGNATAVQEAVSWAVARVMRMNGAMTEAVSAFEAAADGLPDPIELARLLASGG